MRLVLFGAHTGDAVELCGGTLVKHAKRGDTVTTVAMNYGELGYSDRMTGVPLEEIKAARREGFEEGAKILGAKGICLDLGQPLFFDRNAFIKIIGVIRELKPDVIISQHPQDVARYDHSVAGDAVTKACMDADVKGIVTPAPPFRVNFLNLYYSTSHNPYVSPDVYVDITEEGIDLQSRAYYAVQYRTLKARPETDYDDKETALKQLREIYSKGRREAGSQVGVEYAETFTRFVPQYLLDSLNPSRGFYHP